MIGPLFGVVLATAIFGIIGVLVLRLARRSPRCGPGIRTRLLCTILLLGTACVRWQQVAGSAVSERPLPRWVQVTTRDSVHYTLKDARVVPGDTLVGLAENAGSSVRIPIVEIAHLEARVPSGPGSIGVGALVLVGFFGVVAIWARAALAT